MDTSLQSMPLPSVQSVKQQARRLRDTLAGDGTTLTHSRALELVARQYGYRDWNTFHAAIGNRPPETELALGGRVSGHYLGHPFTGQIVAVSTISSAPGHRRVTFKFDEPVDVVMSEGFSNFRRRVSCTLDASGKTVEKTSDGRPHLQLAV